MESAEDILYVYHVFHRSTLFRDNQEEKRYDVELSIQKYKDLCTQELQKAFEDAQILVFDESGISTEEIQFADDCDSEVLETADWICQKVYESFGWQVSLRWFTLKEAGELFDIPIPLIRWACKKGLIEGAEQVSGVWKLPAINSIKWENGILPDCFSEQNIFESESQVCRCEVTDTFRVDLLNGLPAPKIFITIPDGWEIAAFSRQNSSIIVFTVGRKIHLQFEHFAENIPGVWGAWAYDKFSQALFEQAKQYMNVQCCLVECEYAGRKLVESLQLEFSYEFPSRGNLGDLVERAQKNLALIVRDTEISLRGGPTWKKQYEHKGNETLFCKEVLEPLLNKMGFTGVRYIHGTDEHGRDFIFSEETKWGWKHYYGLQAKAGDISGGANSIISTLLEQISDAFTMPHHEVNGEDVYITAFVVGISGHFTRLAKDKIISRIPRKEWRGSVYFLDQNDIRELIRRYWLKSKSF